MTLMDLFKPKWKYYCCVREAFTESLRFADRLVTDRKASHELFQTEMVSSDIS
jgi:hypothetical protein